MSKYYLFAGILSLGLVACSENDITTSPKPQSNFQETPDFLKDLPHFETTPEELALSINNTIQAASERLAGLVSQDMESLNFETAIRTLDDITYPVSNASNRMNLILNTHPDQKMRDAAQSAVNQLNNWFVDLGYREDIYQLVQAFGARNPDLLRSFPNVSKEDLRFFSETQRDFKRNGMNLSSAAKAQLNDMQKKLSDLETQFGVNLNTAKEAATFSKADLDGVPDYLLEKIKIADDQYQVNANVEYQVVGVLENAKKEETRKKLTIANFQVAQKENTPLFEQAISLRDQIAKNLNYPSWADYRTEIKMVKNAKTARDFIVGISDRLQPKFNSEIAEMQKLKARDTSYPNAEIQIWDFRYYMNQLMKEKYNVDKDKLRVYFELGKVQKGVFENYENLFGLKIDAVENIPYKWSDDVKLFSVTDVESKQILGYLYLDLYPRPGKYFHFAEFGIIDGKAKNDGTYAKPVVALVCNFNPASQNEPALQKHEDVETFFHEFGHAMHAILTKAKYSRFSGTNVQGDFVEAPSQMFENWAWDKQVLDRFAEDYQHPGQKIDADLLKKMKEAKLATIGTFYRRQFALGLLDLDLHAAGEKKSSAAITAQDFEKIFLKVPDGTNYSASFGHLMGGYDGGYYGYAWSKAIAQDMLTVFLNSSDGMNDASIGRRLRKEIYEVGGTRDAEESVQAFLGRKWTIDAFVKDLGIQ